LTFGSSIGTYGFKNDGEFKVLGRQYLRFNPNAVSADKDGALTYTATGFAGNKLMIPESQLLAAAAVTYDYRGSMVATNWNYSVLVVNLPPKQPAKEPAAQPTNDAPVSPPSGKQ
jgi:hypothetical protein